MLMIPNMNYKEAAIMTVRECYAQIGADFNEVLERLGTEGMIKKFAIKFLDDKSYDILVKAMQDKDVNEAFRAVHTMKGICLNLGFGRLYTASSELTEALRGGSMDGSDELYEHVKEEYNNTVEAIRGIDE